MARFRERIPSRRAVRAARSRCGFTLVEAVVTLVLLTSVFTLIGTVLVGLNRRGRLADQRRLAQQAAHAVLLDVTSRPWDEMPSAAEGHESVPTDFANALPEMNSTVVVDDGQEPDVRRIVVEISWTDWAHRRVHPTRLVTWVHREGRQ